MSVAHGVVDHIQYIFIYMRAVVCYHGELPGHVWTMPLAWLQVGQQANYSNLTFELKNNY